MEQFKKIFIRFESGDFLLILLGTIILTYLLIELVASIFKDKQKASDFKSQAIANVLSGIVFSMILTLIKNIL